ncbi:unnamed protein product [Medioppia subpectinata]|uniref:C2H2-type domain-containing protein n=1 Tax=Medioppia subpectinata TaxID=1979941 RepID=A0A7R9Q5N0_9ACAR|nr:unnamed protein product [Medioppia subpectinata]CAG2112988.1 unnamed protein product [Medioppia subpectinata]
MSSDVVSIERLNRSIGGQTSVTTAGLNCFGDSQSMDAIANEMMNSSSFDIANSMINSDIADTIQLTAVETNAEAYHQDMHSAAIEYSLSANRLVVTVEDCSDESFAELVQHVSNGSNGLSDGTVRPTTRPRSRPIAGITGEALGMDDDGSSGGALMANRAVALPPPPQMEAMTMSLDSTDDYDYDEEINEEYVSVDSASDDSDSSKESASEPLPDPSAPIDTIKSVTLTMSSDVVSIERLNRSIGGQTSVTTAGLNCFGDSQSMDAIANEMMNSSSFDIANSMINSDIADTIQLTAVETNAEAYHQDMHSAAIEYSLSANRLVVTVEDCSDESFAELVQHVSNGSNGLSDGTVGSVSTRLRRRKATQPQRLIYCDLDFAISDEQNGKQTTDPTGDVINELHTNDNNCEQNGYTIDEMVLTDLDTSGHKVEEEEEEEEEEEIDEEEETVEEEYTETTTEDNETKPQKKNTKGFECEICGSLWNSKTRLRSHYRTHGASKHLKCDICGKLFGWEYSWKTHMLAHRDDNPNRCPHCGLKLFNKSALTNHVKRIHENPERPFKCSVCDKRFISRSELNQHSHVHNEDKPFMCEQCGKTFRSKSYLERHYRTHTGVKPFRCEFCGKLLADKTGFTAHVRSHMGDRPFVCDVCGKKYTIKRHLTSHMMIHSDARPFKCEECGKTFRSRTNARMHKDSHLGVKRWECRFCKRQFLSQGNMAKHVRRHIGDRNHKCLVCGKAFIEKQELKNHSKMHANHEKQLKTPADDANRNTNETAPQMQALPTNTSSATTTITATTITSDVSTHSNTSVKSESEMNGFNDSLLNNNRTDSEMNADLNGVLSSGGAHQTLISLSTPLTLSLPPLTHSLCLQPLNAINMTQTYESVDNNGNTGAVDVTPTELSFCHFTQRPDNSRNFYANHGLNGNRSPPQDSEHTFFTASHTTQPVVSTITTQTNPYLVTTTDSHHQTYNHTIHCSLCSHVFATLNHLRQHLIDFHRVESEKVISMMY